MTKFKSANYLLCILILTGCGVRQIPQQKNAVEAALAEVNNQYKRRADLVPNLVAVVKGYASHESETLIAVTEARSKVSSMNIDPSKVSPDQLSKFQSAQGELSQALGKLMVVVEKYPDLKADVTFRDLQAQLEGTENRITIARQRNIEAIKLFNDLLSTPPESWVNSLFYHYEKLPQWSVDPTEQKSNETAPKVEF